MRKTLQWRLLQRRLLAAAGCLHAASEVEAIGIRAAGLETPIAVVPHGVEVPPRQGPDRSQGPRTVLFLSRLHPIKGLPLLLNAWAVIERSVPEWRLTIAGPDHGKHAREMQQLAAALRLRRVEFLGEVRPNMKSTVLHAADLLVLPSETENFGLVVAEALAHGVPVIVGRGAPWSGVEKTGCGWWIERTHGSLERTLRDALSKSDQELREMGERGRKWMKRDFSWNRVAGMLEETYRWVIDGGPTPGWVWE